MNNVSSRNWTDLQWFNFICGLIKSPSLAESIPSIPDIVGNFQCIFPPGAQIYATTYLEDYQLIVRTSETTTVIRNGQVTVTETRHDYLLDMRDLSLQETDIVSNVDTLGGADYGIIGRVSQYPYLLKTDKKVYRASNRYPRSWNYTAFWNYSSVSANDKFTGMALLNTPTTYALGILALYEDQNSDQHMRLDFQSLSEYFNNIQTDTFYVNGTNCNIKTLSSVNGNLVIWVRRSGDFTGYIVNNLKLHFTDKLVSSSTSIYNAAVVPEVTPTGEEFKFTSIQSLSNYDDTNVFVYTDHYNNTKVAAAGEPSLRTGVASVVHFAVATTSHDTIEFEHDLNTLDVIDGIDPNTIFNNGNTQVTVAANIILLYVFEFDGTQFGYNWYAFNFDTGEIAQVSDMGSVTHGYWSNWTSGITTSDSLVNTSNAAQYRCIQWNVSSRTLYVNRISTSSGQIANDFTYPISISSSVHPLCAAVAEIPYILRTAGQSDQNDGTALLAGIRDESYELYDSSSYIIYHNYVTNTATIHVTYNGVRYCVYKITQSYDGTVVLWIATSTGTVGLEFEDFKVIQVVQQATYVFEGTFTGYVYELPDQTFIMNIKTFRHNIHRVALWSRSYYNVNAGYNKTVTHISYPTYTADTAVITS